MIKMIFMGDVLYVVAGVLIIGWLVGFFSFHVGGIVYTRLVIAVMAILVKLIQGRRVV